MSTSGENGNAPAMAKALDAMWAKFLPDIRERANVLDAASEAASREALGEDLRDSAQAAAHKLAGTLGTFGLQRGTELARELELLFARGRIGPDEADALKEAVAEIWDLIENRS